MSASIWFLGQIETWLHAWNHVKFPCEKKHGSFTQKNKWTDNFPQVAGAASVVSIILYMDLYIPMQSVPICYCEFISCPSCVLFTNFSDKVCHWLMNIKDLYLQISPSIKFTCTIYMTF